jgi:hypothetical protein
MNDMHVNALAESVIAAGGSFDLQAFVLSMNICRLNAGLSVMHVM